MPKKNDLSMFKPAQQSEHVEPKEPKHLLSPKKPGRKAKRPEDKESEIVAIKLTKSELETLETKAGLVPKSTYLKHILRTETDLFD